MKKPREKKPVVPPREGPVVIIVPTASYNPYSNEPAKSVLPKLVRKPVATEIGERGLPPGVRLSAYLR